MRYQLVAILFTVAGALSCMQQQNTPDAAMKQYFACFNKQDADCVQSFHTENETNLFGKTPLQRKENIQEFFKRKQNSNLQFIIKNQAATATTAEFEITQKGNSGTESYPMIYTLVKTGDSTWKIDDVKSKQN